MRARHRGIAGIAIVTMAWAASDCGGSFVSVPSVGDASPGDGSTADDHAADATDFDGANVDTGGSPFDGATDAPCSPGANCTTDSGIDASNDGPPVPDGAPREAGGTTAFDGTVGLPCQSDADCRPAGGPGLNACSTTLFADAVFPTPVCVSPQCDPGADGLAHFCDGPDDPSSPGFCLAIGNGTGVCLPSCIAPADGSRPAGCVETDACVVSAFARDATTSQPVAIGYCFGGCTADDDCPAGNRCQVDVGTCVRTPTAPTKALGAPCTAADNGSATVPATCNCLVDPNTGNGYCTAFCEVGSPAAGCPSGYLCDSFEPLQLTDSTGAIVPGFVVQNAGLAGNCVAACSAADGGGCPAASVCSTSDTAGDDCLP